MNSCAKDPAAVALDDFCRLCLRQHGSEWMLPWRSHLPSDESQTSIPDMLVFVCGLPANMDESLPQRICKDCVSQLQQAFRFCCKVKEKETILERFLSSGAVLQRLSLYEKFRSGAEKPNVSTEQAAQNSSWNYDAEMNASSSTAVADATSTPMVEIAQHSQRSRQRARQRVMSRTRTRTSTVIPTSHVADTTNKNPEEMQAETNTSTTKLDETNVTQSNIAESTCNSTVPRLTLDDGLRVTLKPLMEIVQQPQQVTNCHEKTMDASSSTPDVTDAAISPLEAAQDENDENNVTYDLQLDGTRESIICEPQSIFQDGLVMKLEPQETMLQESFNIPSPTKSALSSTEPEPKKPSNKNAKKTASRKQWNLLNPETMLQESSPAKPAPPSAEPKPKMRRNKKAKEPKPSPVRKRKPLHPDVDGLFRCTYCAFANECKIKTVQHIAVHRALMEERYKCKYCGDLFTKNSGLVKHMEKKNCLTEEFRKCGRKRTFKSTV